MSRERNIGKINNKSANDAWHHTYANIHKAIPKSYIDQLTSRTVRQIQRLTRKRVAALCWSGGKDSILIEKLCEMAGTVHRGVWVTAEQIEFPSFYEWAMKNKPAYMHVEERGFDLDWLKENPSMMFPKLGDDFPKIRDKWDNIFQRKGQSLYLAANPEIEVKIMGRRRQDGNWCGNGTNVYSTNDGMIHFNPIADWTHHEMLAFFHYNDVPLPPLYTTDFPHGWIKGTLLWCQLALDDDEVNTWRYLYAIDKTIVINAADHFESARLMLESPEIPFKATIELNK